MSFFTEIAKSILKFIWKHKRSQRAKTILSEKNNDEDMVIPDLKLYYRVIGTKTALYSTQIDTWTNGIEEKIQK
jgi:hypothetical protein